MSAKSTSSSLLGVAVALACFALAIKMAYEIRLFAIQEFGRIIHEFDPWFNMRATRYLARNGWTKFFSWFDHESWYPLGRPVGTTIYPGLQLVAVAIWNVLAHLGPAWTMSLNDVCVFFPAWFGAVSTVLLGLLTWECTGSPYAAGLSALIMAIIPAHLMRSVGGGFDNESLAISCMVGTFLFWLRSIRNDGSWGWGILAGLMQVAMAAAWGGYVFVSNMVGVHAIGLVFLGHWSPGVTKAYALWWLIGAVGSSFIPVVGMAPFRSAEQLGPLGVFGILVVLYWIDLQATQRKMSAADRRQFTIRVFGTVATASLVAMLLLASLGFFGPLSVRVRSLFFRHTRTGNPLVDSVSEHQPASASAYWQHLLQCMYLAPIGFVLCVMNRTRAKLFLVFFGVASFYFARKMNRLIILSGPIAAALAGIALEFLLRWSVEQLAAVGPWAGERATAPAPSATSSDNPAAAAAAAAKKDKKDKKASSLLDSFTGPGGTMARASVAFMLLLIIGTQSLVFVNMANQYSHAVSQPSLMYKARLSNGQEIIVDDYVKGYEWIKANTPADSRVLSWWDYGYQIAGIANRTTLADGNTWNLEHIALIGKMLTAPQADAHAMIRHLADYVLVWAGGGGDDLAKSPHIARIASSVYDGICPNDPFCRTFGFEDGPEGRRVTPSMGRSLLYNMVKNGMEPGAKVDPSLFREVWASKYGLMRVYKVLNVDEQSKRWLADPSNRSCDRPGSWYCPGNYPPAIARPPPTHRHLDYEKDGRGAVGTH